MLAPAAQIPGWIVADAIRRQARLDHHLRLVEQALGDQRIVLDALDMEFVGVLAHRQIIARVSPVRMQMGICAKCCGFALTHPLGDEFPETLGRMRLEFQDVRVFERFEETPGQCHQANRQKMTTVGFDLNLPAGFGIDFRDH